MAILSKDFMMAKPSWWPRGVAGCDCEVSRSDGVMEYWSVTLPFALDWTSSKVC